MSGFLVRRLRWYEHDPVTKLHHRLPGERPVAWFADREDAEDGLGRRERGPRQGVNPFRYGGSALGYQMSFDPPRFHDWLLDAGLEPPGPDACGPRDWVGWWERTAST